MVLGFGFLGVEFMEQLLQLSLMGLPEANEHQQGLAKLKPKSRYRRPQIQMFLEQN